MVRGMTTFKCDDCGNKFVAIDAEWQATVYTAPQPCPSCKSMHTYPIGLLRGLFGPGYYRTIWKRNETK